MAITYGLVPKPAFKDYLYVGNNKREGFGWDNLGKRNPKFVVLHRMVGTLAGTDSWFASPSVGSLTDFGMAVTAIEGAAKSGEIHQYNDPLGYRSPWASGPVSSPYGDGAAIVNKYGINAVNRDGVSLEISGQYTTPLSENDKNTIASFLAYWWDQMKIPYDQAPLNPATGISAVVWHQEFTIGTSKICPGPVVMDATPDLIERAKAILKQYQTKSGPAPKPDPDPDPVKPTYATPSPIAALAPYGKGNDKDAKAIVTAEGTDFIFVNDRVRAVVDTPRLQVASTNAKKVGPVIKKGEEFDVLWLFKAKDGKYYYYTPWSTRVIAADTELVE